jgi:hypothetical protein
MSFESGLTRFRQHLFRLTPTSQKRPIDNIGFDNTFNFNVNGNMKTIIIVVRPILKATGQRVRVPELEVEYHWSETSEEHRLFKKSDTDEMTIVDHLPISNDWKYYIIARVPPYST